MRSNNTSKFALVIILLIVYMNGFYYFFNSKTKNNSRTYIVEATNDFRFKSFLEVKVDSAIMASTNKCLYYIDGEEHQVKAKYIFIKPN